MNVVMLSINRQARKPSKRRDPHVLRRAARGQRSQVVTGIVQGVILEEQHGLGACQLHVKATFAGVAPNRLNVFVKYHSTLERFRIEAGTRQTEPFTYL